MIRARAFVAFALLLSSSCAPVRQPSGAPSTTAATGTVSIQLLALNDFHGHLEPPPGSNGRVGTVEAGGAEYLATHLQQAIAQQPNSIVVAAGDLIGASPLVSSMFHDEPAIEALNTMGLAVASVGNHEFDEGAEELLRMRRGGCHPADGCQDGDPFGGAAFEYLSANVVARNGGAPLLPGTTVRTIGGVAVGFIGVTTRTTAVLVPPGVTKAVDFIDEAETANAQAAELKRRGVHAVVLLIHEGLRQRGDGPSDPNGCISPGGDLDAILSRLSDDIRVVVSGHTHGFYNCRVGGRLVTSAGSYGRGITKIQLRVDARSGAIVDATAVNDVVTRDVAKHPAVSAILAKYGTLVHRIASAIVGSVAGDLRTAANAAGETALGNVIADAQLAAASPKERGGAQVAFMNRGGVRAEILAAKPAGAGAASPVTYRDLHSVQPFGNTVMAFTMTGDTIRRLLEEQFEGTAGGFRVLQVSRGFTYRYRPAAPAGERVDAASIRLDGRQLAPADRVRVAASDFLLNGGDGFKVFAEATERQAVIGDIEALVEYFKARSPVAAPPLDRIVRVE